jgi:hypothetical protein
MATPYSLWVFVFFVPLLVLDKLTSGKSTDILDRIHKDQIDRQFGWGEYANQRPRGERVDARDLKSLAEGHAGSSPAVGTTESEKQRARRRYREQKEKKPCPSDIKRRRRRK